MPIKRLLATLLLALALVAPAWADQPQFRFTGVERVVAVGDVHGSLHQVSALLRDVGLVDDELTWQGGSAHLVSTGDLLDRGDHGREVLDLFMRLQAEAVEAGGAVHVLLGNHEVMNLVGDLRYVSDGDHAGFGGRAARRQALAPDGPYGAWLLERPVMIVVNDTLFVHGGLSSALAGLSLEEINRAAQRDVRRVAEGWHALVAGGHMAADDGIDVLEARARQLADGQKIVEALDGLPFARSGPLWYRGSSLCHPYAETETVRAVLDQLGARRVAVGHTVTADRRITSRLGGHVLRMDTGMNHDAYGGRASALVLEGGDARAFYAGEGLAHIEPEPNRVWDRPYGMSDAEIEAFLETAAVVHDEEIGTGVTRPRRLTLEQDGRRLRAAFKTVDTDPNMERRRWDRRFEHADRYQYEVAAYRLDRLLGLHMLPVAVLRTIDDEDGALVLWLEDTISETERRARGIRVGGYCDMRAQSHLMNAFHILIHNVDPNLGNILYDRSWDLWLIDHSRAFRTAAGVPRMVAGARIEVSPQMAAALARVNRQDLDEVAPYLHPRQIQALVRRAEWLRNQ